MKNKGYKVLEDLAKKETDEQRKKRKNGLTIENLAKKGTGRPKAAPAKSEDHKANTLHIVRDGMPGSNFELAGKQEGVMRLKREP